VRGRNPKSRPRKKGRTGQLRERDLSTPTKEGEKIIVEGERTAEIWFTNTKRRSTERRSTTTTGWRPNAA